MKDKIYTKCLKCNRPLKTPIAQKRGYGEACWRKLLEENKQKTYLLRLK